MIYYSYFQSVMNCGLIFRENSSYSNSIFKIQQRIIRIIMGTETRHYCRELFKILNILPLHSQYILSLVLFVVYKKNTFKINSQLHSINARNNYNLSETLSHLTITQEDLATIKVFNGLYPHISDVSHKIKIFKSSLQR